MVKNELHSQYIKRGRERDLPSFGVGATIGQGYPAGHLFVHAVTGEVFVNLGNSQYSMHARWLRNRHVLEERFLRPPKINADILNASEAVRMIANPDFEILGTNATSDDSTLIDGGGVKIETDGADGDGVIILPHLDAGQSSWTATKWNTNDEISFETLIRTTSAVLASQIIWAGFKLTNTDVIATDADQTYFRFEDDVASGSWQVTDSNTGVDNTQTVSTSLIAAVALATDYWLRIQVDGNRVPRYYINGYHVATGNALKADVDLIPYIAVRAAGAAAVKSIICRGIACGKSYND